MQIVPMGANVPLTGPAAQVTLTLPTSIDITALVTYAGGKVRGDGDMCFFNSPSIHHGAVSLQSASGTATLRVDTSRLGAEVEKVVITATLEDASANFGSVTSIGVDVDGAYDLQVTTQGMQEAALILAEIYRRGESWKVRNVSQGFNGGLAALATHFGIEVAAEATPVAAPKSSISLEKKLVSLEKKDPGLVSLVKKVGVSLEKKNVGRDRAKVALVLDISGSMNNLYRSGKIQTLVQRVMALGYRLDDDGEIDTFLFGRKVHEFGPVGIDRYKHVVDEIRRDYSLEGDTRYGVTIERVRQHYALNNPEGLPVFVMFVTDGNTSDKDKTERELRDASSEPIFWKFMAINERGGGFFGGVNFDFLEKLDDLTGRVVDNADTFILKDPAQPSDEEMFDLMMTEYGDWIRAAERAGIL
ncbi:VWA domain-containing protein [Epibacterium sp. DP7N7-1]|nr:VWA domain-containing protein [Epibacterium sp. DP7N7-1]